ncbi:hypothetical protein EDC01DRAFT_626583 [Geopyxis carbonaria]|nr:hypothetical protein EDC01DRAFT_626583 [Geopyxis carbonaria]
MTEQSLSNAKLIEELQKQVLDLDKGLDKRRDSYTRESREIVEQLARIQVTGERVSEITRLKEQRDSLQKDHDKYAEATLEKIWILERKLEELKGGPKLYY